MPTDGLAELPGQRSRRSRPVRVLGLPLVAELGHRALLAVRDEDRVEAEAFRPARFLGDAAFERARAAELASVRRERDELADVAGAPVGLAVERLEDPLDVPALRPARRLDARGPVQRIDLEPRVLAEHPCLRRSDLAAVKRLAARVLQEPVAGLRRIVARVEQLDRPAGERLPQLAQL